MLTRRDFVRRASAGVGAAAALVDGWQAQLAAADRGTRGSALDVAADEDYWHGIQQAFTLDRTMVNLNNGGVSPSPRVVHEAYKRYLDISNQAPSVLHVADAGAQHRDRPAAARRERSAATAKNWRLPAMPAKRCKRRSLGSP